MDFKHDVGLRLIKACNIVYMTMAFAITWFYFYAINLHVLYYFWGHMFTIALFSVFYILFGKTYDSFTISQYRISDIVTNQTLSLVITNAVMYLVLILLIRSIPNPIPLLVCFIDQVSLSMIWATLAHKIYFKWFPAKKTIIVYDMRRGMNDLIESYGLSKKFDVISTVPLHQCLEDLSVVDNMEVVFLSGINSHDRNIILKYCLYQKKMVYMIPRVGDVIMSGAMPMHMFHLPIMRVSRANPRPEYLFVKRVFDIIASLLALIILSPVLIITAIAIKATDKGPVFYKQERLTKDGKRFMIHKFRSMRVDAEKDGVARLSTGDNDDRITPIGKTIRKFRIDELPQLLDILLGNMSIVGPRPERPQIAKEYEKEMPEFQLRLQVKAGLTGYAQVYGKYNTTPYDKLQMDLMYIAHPGFIEDLRICFATLRILFVPESTEGIAAGQTTALMQDVEDDHSSGCSS